MPIFSRDEKTMTRRYPKTNRHKSRQDHPTPWEFVSALEKRFGLIAVDLASTARDAKAGRFISPKENSFKQDWTNLLNGENGYLNPEWDPITPWVEKCIEEKLKGGRFTVLSQASIDSDWYWAMEKHCCVYTLKSRIRFEGSKHVYPKPLILSAFNLKHEPGPTIERGKNGLYRWNWKLDVNGR